MTDGLKSLHNTLYELKDKFVLARHKVTGFHGLYAFAVS